MYRPAIVFDGTAVAKILEGGADIHYGFIITLRKTGAKLTIKKALERLEKGNYSTSPAERARRAKIPFTSNGLTFHSREEVIRTATLFRERHGSEKYPYGRGRQRRTNARIRRQLGVILKEVRRWYDM